VGEMIRISVLLVIMAANPSVAQTFADSLGIAWNTSIEEVRGLSIQLEKSDKEGRFTYYNTKQLPINRYVDADYSLTFDNEYKLQKITIKVPIILNDFDGEKGKNLYQEIKTELLAKYGKPIIKMEEVGKGTGQFAFYQCLKATGCGHWASTFESAEEVVIIEIKGKGIGHGYIQLTVEGPYWLDALYENKMQYSQR